MQIHNECDGNDNKSLFSVTFFYFFYIIFFIFSFQFTHIQALYTKYKLFLLENEPMHMKSEKVGKLLKLHNIQCKH